MFSHFCWCRSNDNEIFGSGLSGFVPPTKRLDKDSLTISMEDLEELYRESYAIVDRLRAVVKRIPETDEEQSLARASGLPPSSTV